MVDHRADDVKIRPVVRLVHLSARHAGDLATLAADDWDVVGFVARAQRLRARRERGTFAGLDAGRPVGGGMLGSDPSAVRQAELGYWIGPRERGLGYATAAAHALMTRAFGRLARSVVFARCADDNPASARVLTKLGFRPVGNPREATSDEGTQRY